MEIERTRWVQLCFICGKSPATSEELTRSRLIEDIQHKIPAMVIGV